MRSPDQNRDGNAKKKKVKVAYLVSHPIQYQAPLLRRIAQEPDIELTVFFGSDFSVQEYVDKGFGVDVKWDVPSARRLSLRISPGDMGQEKNRADEPIKLRHLQPASRKQRE